MIATTLPDSLIVTPQMPVRGVIFDMDGLLFDTESLGIEASMKAAALCRLSLPMSLARDMIGCSEEQCHSALAAYFGPATSLDEFFFQQEVCLSRLVQEGRLQLKPGVMSLLGLLDDRNIPRAIATSSSHARAWGHLEALALAERFDAVVTRDDVILGKPDPEPYLLAAARIGVTAELCLALEDSPVGARAAWAAGIRVILVPDLAQPDVFVTEHALAIVQNLDIATDYLTRYAR